MTPRAELEFRAEFFDLRLSPKIQLPDVFVSAKNIPVHLRPV
jgi:hypothetical protein